MKLLTLAECAAKKGVTRMTVYNAIQRGDLAASRKGKGRGLKVQEEACEQWTPLDHHSGGKRGAAIRWEGHVVEEKPKRPRGRPRKNKEQVTTLTTNTTKALEE